MKANTHSFNVELAAAIGLNQCILLQHLYYWYQHNKVKKTNIKDGLVWTYSTADSISEVFPYLTSKQIRTALDKLEKDGYIIIGNYNKSKFDKTKWYSLTEKSLLLFGNSILQNVTPDLQNVTPECQNVNAIPDIKRDIKGDTSKDVSSDDADEVKKKLYWKFVDLYPDNRRGNRQQTLKNWMKLTPEEMKLAVSNIARYLQVAGPYVKKMSNYLDERCFTEEWLQAEERNKSQKSNKRDTGHNFSGEY